jgi:hypothetical protein
MAQQVFATDMNSVATNLASVTSGVATVLADITTGLAQTSADAMSAQKRTAALAFRYEVTNLRQDVSDLNKRIAAAVTQGVALDQIT